MILKTGKWILLFILLLAGIAWLWILSRPDMSEVGIPYAVPASTESGLRVRWLGVATLLIDDGETQIMTDGFVSRPSVWDLLFGRPIEPDRQSIQRAVDDHQIDRLAAIVPVHSHYDHAMDTADFSLITGADILGSESTANIARSSQVEESRIKTVRLGDSYRYGKFTITFYEGKHAPLATNSAIAGTVDQPFGLPAPYTAWKEGGSYSIHIAHPDGSMLVHGSAGFVPGALKGVQADVVFLGSGGLMTLTPTHRSDYVDEVVHAVKPAQVYIIHHDDLIGEFGNVEQNKIVLSFDKITALELLQLVLPAQLEQLAFGVDVSINDTAD